MNRLRKDLKVAHAAAAAAADANASTASPCGITSSSSSHYHWSSQSYTLSELVSSFTLPRVVMCAVESCYLNNMDFEFDLKQPLLIFSFREARKLQTKCLEYNEVEETYVEYGPDLIIPEDYNGWFYCPDPEEEGDSPPPCHEDAQAVADARAKAVITMSEAIALHQPDSALLSGEDSYEQRPVEPGKVLRVLGTNCVKGKSHHMLTNSKSKTRFLKCFSESNDVLLIPFTSNTAFCELPLDGPDSRKYATMKDIIKRKDFPFRMHLVCGNLPPILDSFMGLVMAHKTIKESTVMASTMSSSDPLPLELKIDTPVRFYMALNNFDIQQRDEYYEALHMCNNQSEEYLQNMKVAFKVNPRISAIHKEKSQKRTRKNDTAPPVESHLEDESGSVSSASASASPASVSLASFNHYDNVCFQPEETPGNISSKNYILDVFQNETFI